MGQALVRRILNRVPCVCINPAEGGGTDPPGKLDDQPCQCTESEPFWPCHMDIREEYTCTCTANNQYHRERF